MVCGLAAALVGCSPSIESGAGSFESGATAPAADDDDGDAMDASSSTGMPEGDPTTDGTASAACRDYLACLGALDSQELDAMMSKFGPEGSCFASEPAQTCDGRCEAAMEGLSSALDPLTSPTECGGDGIQVTPENTDAACMDGKDNDANGLFDCDDPACNALGVTACVSAQENSDAACSDGHDNDGDDHVDCDDYDCSMNPSITVCTVAEDTQAACSDDIDNDGDGHFDCDDYDCSMNPAIDCSFESTNSSCSDDQDNDGDDYVDCDDYDCSMNPQVTVCG